jgi:hypothetical protein
MHRLPFVWKTVELAEAFSIRVKRFFVGEMTLSWISQVEPKKCSPEVQMIDLIHSPHLNGERYTIERETEAELKQRRSQPALPPQKLEAFLQELQTRSVCLQWNGREEHQATAGEVAAGSSRCLLRFENCLNKIAV